MAASDAAQTKDEVPGKPVENFTTNYYFHAQQALIVASVGGLSGALQDSSPSVEADGPPPEIGRSLFLALDLVTWVADADVILEVGWAAVWFQDKLEADADDEATFQEMRDRGHYV